MVDSTLTHVGNVRLRVQTETGRWVRVGPLRTLGGARRLAEDLITQASVRAVRVEHRQRGMWRPAWSWLAGAGLLLLTLTGCALHIEGPGDLATLKADARECAGRAYQAVPPSASSGNPGLDLSGALIEDAARERARTACMRERGWEQLKVGTYRRVR